jgi:hypothetical protein
MIDYQSPGTPAAQPRRRGGAALLLLAVTAFPATLSLSFRSLQLDYRGNAIYAEREREREAKTLKSFFTHTRKGFDARETSRSGWKRGQAMMAISILAAGAAIAAARDRRWRGRAIVIAAVHFVLTVAMGGYWIVTGIPQPWVD